MPPQPRPLWDRFWPKVDMRGGLTACWIWRGARSQKRSGTTRGLIQAGGRGSRYLLAHRVALCLAGEGVEAEYDRPLVAAHRCGNRLCCNSYSHMYWASPAENLEDRQWEDHRQVCYLHISRYDIAFGYGADPAHLEYLELLESVP